MDYSILLQQQNIFFNSEQTKSIDYRIIQLQKLKRIFIANEKLLYEATYADFKKSEFDTFTTELNFIYQEIDSAIKNLPRWSKKKRKFTNIINQPGRSYIMPEPLGICLVIGAWNYPIQLSISPVIAAIAAGNTVILKPSELSAATSAVLAKLINNNFPIEFFYVAEGGVSETTSLLEQKFDKIFFTGSTSVGKIIYQAAAKNLTPVTLELGGKSPAIVYKCGNLKVTAKRLIWAKFLNAGQTCIAPDFVFVEDSAKEELLAHMKSYLIAFNYSIANNNYVQIVNEANFNRLKNLIKKQNVFYGGNSDEGNRVIEPTILINVGLEEEIMKNEIFGPILPVLAFSNITEVVKVLKGQPKPLACYIFTSETKVKETLLNSLSFGGGAINDAMMHVSNGNLPFGGVGNSGMGNYHGEFGFACFSHYKSILEKPFWLEPNFKYSPISKSKLFWIKKLLKI